MRFGKVIDRVKCICYKYMGRISEKPGDNFIRIIQNIRLKNEMDEENIGR